MGAGCLPKLRAHQEPALCLRRATPVRALCLQSLRRVRARWYHRSVALRDTPEAEPDNQREKAIQALARVPSERQEKTDE
jgi:hypothetical protein